MRTATVRKALGQLIKPDLKIYNNKHKSFRTIKLCGVAMCNIDQVTAILVSLGATDVKLVIGKGVTSRGYSTRQNNLLAHFPLDCK